jgi:hypothetical protein
MLVHGLRSVPDMTSAFLRVPLLCVPLALLWLLPGVSHAAQQPPAEPSTSQAPAAARPEPGPAAPQTAAPEPRAIPGTQPDAPRRLMTQEDPWQPPVRAPTPRGLRILAEVGAGVGGSVVLGLGGTLLGLGVCALGLHSDSSGYENLLCLIPAGIGLLAGVLVGFPLGTWMVGEGLGGNGSFLTSLGFGALGAVVGLFLQVVPGAPLILLAAGSILGYELFQHAPVPLGSSARLQPLLSFSERGGPLVGLSGHF